MKRGTVGGDHAQRHLGRHDRRPKELRQLAHALLGAARHHAAARHDQRPARLPQQLGGGGNFRCADARGPSVTR